MEEALVRPVPSIERSSLARITLRAPSPIEPFAPNVRRNTETVLGKGRNYNTRSANGGGTHREMSPL